MLTLVCRLSTTVPSADYMYIHNEQLFWLCEGICYLHEGNGYIPLKAYSITVNLKEKPAEKCENKMATTSMEYSQHMKVHA